MLRNLNVFIACWVIAGATIGAPIALLVSLALRPILGERAASNYMFMAGYLVLGLVFAVAWWKTGLSPDARKPEREGRFKAGHRVLGATSILCGVALVLPFLLARITGNSDLAMLAWFALPVYMLAFVAWPAGLFMVWSSRA